MLSASSAPFGRREPEPAGGQHAQDVAVGEHRAVAVAPARSAITRSTRAPTSSAVSPSGGRVGPHRPAGHASRGSRRWSGPRSRRSPTPCSSSRSSARSPRPASSQVSTCALRAGWRARVESAPREALGQAAWPVRVPRRSAGTSVRPVWRPVALHSVSPCRARRISEGHARQSPRSRAVDCNSLWRSPPQPSWSTSSPRARATCATCSAARARTWPR